MLDYQGITNTYEREINTKPQNKLTLFILLFILNVVTFSYPIIYKGYQSVVEKNAKILEYNQVNRDLESNLEKVSSYRNYMNSKEAQIATLNRAIPSHLESAEFLMLLTDAASPYGYLVEKLQVDNSNPNEVIINIDMLGPSSTASSVIKDVENLSRLTIIDDVKVKPSNDALGVLEITFKVRIFAS